MTITPETIHDHINRSFRLMYPSALMVHVYGAGSETIDVHIYPQRNRRVYTKWICEIDSDDDGAFWFRLTDTDLVLKIPYPA